MAKVILVIIAVLANFNYSHAILKCVNEKGEIAFTKTNCPDGYKIKETRSEPIYYDTEIIDKNTTSNNKNLNDSKTVQCEIISYKTSDKNVQDEKDKFKFHKKSSMSVPIKNNSGQMISIGPYQINVISIKGNKLHSSKGNSIALKPGETGEVSGLMFDDHIGNNPTVTCHF